MLALRALCSVVCSNLEISDSTARVVCVLHSKISCSYSPISYFHKADMITGLWSKITQYEIAMELYKFQTTL